ncbi:reverse transcriptase domain-containing protein [Kitasatospora sp. NPDC004614]|uniref:reverse transcriptase domain-containing protein n=1 Tax=unclassified Kitasatospora TaxID=2633591 RepID=UPI0036AF9D24
MQAKLHRWAVADPGRRFDDLFNFVCDPAALIVAFDRVAGNRGARTAGVDGLTVADVAEQVGVPGFLDGLRAGLKDGSFRPLPVRERKIPKPGGSGKLRRLGIPTVADRVVQAALKLVLEPVFEADFLPCSYGFRPKRRAQDAIAEIHHFGSRGSRWVLDADIEACFDSIDHTALMDRVRLRVKDKRVLALVKAFLKAGVLTELGGHQDTVTGTPQGGILSPLLANLALSVLDEYVMEPWKPGGAMSTHGKCDYRHRKGRPTWRLVRCADDFVVLVHGSREHVEALREDVAVALASLGLRLSPAKTQVVHGATGSTSSASVSGGSARGGRTSGTSTPSPGPTTRRADTAPPSAPFGAVSRGTLVARRRGHGGWRPTSRRPRPVRGGPVLSARPAVALMGTAAESSVEHDGEPIGGQDDLFDGPLAVRAVQVLAGELHGKASVTVQVTASVVPDSSVRVIVQSFLSTLFSLTE